MSRQPKWFGARHFRLRKAVVNEARDGSKRVASTRNISQVGKIDKATLICASVLIAHQRAAKCSVGAIRLRRGNKRGISGRHDGSFVIKEPAPPSPNRGGQADDEVGEPDTKEPGIPEGIPTTARPLIGRTRSVQTKKYRHMAVVVRLCGSGRQTRPLLFQRRFRLSPRFATRQVGICKLARSWQDGGSYSGRTSWLTRWKNCAPRPPG